MCRKRTRIGRRKKYTDQKKRQPLSLMVSIPRCNLAVQVSTALAVQCSPSSMSSQLHCDSDAVFDLTVSLPVSSFFNGSLASVSALAHRLSIIFLPPQWVISCDSPLTLSKVSVIDEGNPSVTVGLSICIKDDFQWVTMIGSHTCTFYHGKRM